MKNQTNFTKSENTISMKSPEAVEDAVKAPDLSLNATLRDLYKRNGIQKASTPPDVSKIPPPPLHEFDVSKKEEKSSNDIQIDKLEVKRIHHKKRRLYTDLEGSSKKGGTEAFTAAEPPATKLMDLGGIDGVLEEVHKLIIHPMKHPEIFQHLKIEPPRGIILHGPPGSGKTKLAFAIAGECGRPFFHVAAPELVSGMSGESEAQLRSLFDSARAASPCLLFIDEIDAITPKRESASKEMERRIVSQLSLCMDNLAGSCVIVLAATNRVDSLDPMIRRNGRFDREISLGIPDEGARAKILMALCKSYRLCDDIDYNELAKLTPGFAGADLSAVALEASLTCISRIFKTVQPIEDKYTEEQLSFLSVEHRDFVAAIKKVQPSARREGFSTIPDVAWEDVGALNALRKELEERVVLPIKEAESYKALGLDVPAGVLLYGPPGCGKTLLAKAVANESGANFISVKGPELLNKYVGESEKAVRQLFARARISAPCMIFFDELDSLCPKRSNEGNHATERVVNQLLTEMDGVQDRHGVYVIAATNRPDIIDPAMLRPGRLDRRMYVPLPDVEGRNDILHKLGRNLPLAECVDLQIISQQTEGYSGADLASVLREAALLALETNRVELKDRAADATSAGVESQSFSKPTGASAIQIRMTHLLGGVSRTTPSVNPEEASLYMPESMN